MSSDNHQKALIGSLSEGSFWLYDSNSGYDLTHSSSPIGPRIENAITLQTTTSAITVDPGKSALVIIDMQNFFLSPALGRPAESKGLAAQDQLLKHAIPAARKAGIQVAWLNWGLTDQDLQTLPPAIHRTFGFSTLDISDYEHVYKSSTSPCSEDAQVGRLNAGDLGKDSRLYKGLGQMLGDVTLTDGSSISAGRMLMCQQWNTELSPPLDRSFKSSLELSKPDVWLNKTRMSGLHLPSSPAGSYFQKNGIKTLFFAGVNTDQCVNSTLTDAFCQGYDCILLRDGCATSTPVGQECVEWNVAKTMGFVAGCQDLAEGVLKSLTRQGSLV